MEKYCIVQTTTDDEETASQITNILLKENLAACIQSHMIQSSYRWKGKIENSKEIILNIKTRYSLFEKIKQKIEENHNYEVPEIIVIPILNGNGKYLRWIDEETK